LRSRAARAARERVARTRLGFRRGPVGLREGAADRALLPVGDPEVVVALANPLPPAGPLEGGAGDLPGSDRLGVSSPQVTDDAQVVGAAAHGRRIAVQAGEHEGPRAVVRGLVETPADQRHGAPCVQCTAPDSPSPALARLLQRRIQPAEPLSVAPDARLRGPVQQRETRGLYELTALAGGEIVDHLGVLSRRGELLGLIDYNCRCRHRVFPPLSTLGSYTPPNRPTRRPRTG